jgi:hypothetical protein
MTLRGLCNQASPNSFRAERAAKKLNVARCCGDRKLGRGVLRPYVAAEISAGVWA